MLPLRKMRLQFDEVHKLKMFKEFSKSWYVIDEMGYFLTSTRMTMKRFSDMRIMYLPIHDKHLKSIFLTFKRKNIFNVKIKTDEVGHFQTHVHIYI